MRQLKQGGAPPVAPEYPSSSGEYACGQERASTEYLNIPSVQKAIHVKLVNKQKWGESTGLNYSKIAGSLLTEYKEKLLPNYRIMQVKNIQAAMSACEKSLK